MEETRAKAGQEMRPIESKWFQLSDSKMRTGLSKSTLYELIKRGDVKSILVKGRGAKSGTRLVSIDSVHEYFDKLAEEQNQGGVE